MIKRVLTMAIGLPLLAVAGIVVFEPTEVEPVAWKPSPAPSMTEGPYATNTLLNSMEVFGRSNLIQAESVAVGKDGLLYTGLASGEIVRIDPKRLRLDSEAEVTPFEVVANTNGRPLGLVFHPDGRLIVADAIKGLVAISIPANPKTESGAVEVLTAQSDGLAFKFTDDVAVSPDGRFAYFSDASTKFGLGRYTLDLLEHAGNGRLIEYDFEKRTSRTLLKGMQFANGVTMSADGQSVLVNETGAYRITRYWVKGPKAGTSEVFVDNLPGFPDNIRTDQQGNYWVAMPSKRNPMVDGLAPYPTVRKAMAKLLNYVKFPVQPYAMALAFDESGKVVANLQAPKGGGYYYYTTQVTPVDGQLYFNSVTITGMGKLPNPLP